MANLNLAVKHRIFAALVAAIITPTAIAGFIYTWQDDSPNGYDVSGMISFGDEINFGDRVVSVDSIQAFDFLITESDGEFRVRFGRDDIATDIAFLVGPDGLHEPGKVAKKKTATITPLGLLDLANDDGYLYFDLFDGQITSKKIKGDALSGLPAYTDWFGIGLIFGPEPEIDPDTGKKVAQSKGAKLDIQGQWALASSLPEPASFTLMLIGLFAVGGLLRRRIR